MTLEELQNQIITCRRCPRLVQHREEVARVKVKRFRDQEYWGRPVPAFGDPEPEIVIVGLAPAAHGANRTGRMFTGDSSGDWLYRALYENGFANQPDSTHAGDGLQLNQVFITASIRCAPPQNKPTAEEIRNCRDYLEDELNLFKNVKGFIALGQIAYINLRHVYCLKKQGFGHDRLIDLPDGKFLLCSYHPSRQNTQTGKLKWDDWNRIFKRARELVNEKE